MEEIEYSKRKIKHRSEKSKSFEDLTVWQKTHQLVLFIYGISKDFPKDERFGLISQIRRAAVSVSANIAESYRKVSKKEKVHF